MTRAATQLLRCARSDIYPLDAYEAMVFDRSPHSNLVKADEKDYSIFSVYYAQMTDALNTAGFMAVGCSYGPRNMEISGSKNGIPIRFFSGPRPIPSIVAHAEKQYELQVKFAHDRNEMIHQFVNQQFEIAD
jgi:hypothetical protein